MAVGGLTALFLLVVLARTMSLAAATPGAGGVLALVVGLLPVALGTALPVGLLFGLATAARTWRLGGDWRALATAGRGTRSVVPGVLGLGLLAACLLAGIGQVAEPAGRRQVRVALTRAVGELHLRPSQPVMVGDALVVAEEVDGEALGGVVIASGPTALTARTGRLSGGGAVGLVEGEALQLGDDGAVTARLQFTTATLRLDVEGPRQEIEELSASALRARVERMQAAGRDATAEALALHKRSSLPAGLPLLALLAVPLGARGGRPGAVSTAVVAGWWVVLRLSDQAAPGLGPLVAAWLPTVAVAAAAAVAWATWRDR